MSTTVGPRTPEVWRVLRAVNRRVAVRVLERGRGLHGLVLLLATTGRRSGQPRGRALKRIAGGKAVLAIEVRGSMVPATVTEGVHHAGRA